MKATAPTAERYCPHCQLLVESAAGPRWPRTPLRCPHCHLLIGAGRGQTEPSGDAGTKGAAAGVFSRQAKRSTEEPGATPDEVLEGIRTVAKQLGERPERLLMVDYQQMTVQDADLPSLSDIFTVYGGWKAARRHAAG
jgi:hypothetical protein